MPVCQRTSNRMRCQVCPKPLFLRRASLNRDNAVQYDDVPGTQVVTVIALPEFTCSCSEIIKITCGICSVVIMVAWGWIGACLVTSPGWIITIRKLCDRSIWIRIIPCGEYSSGYAVQQCRCRFITLAGAICDI